MAGSQDAHSCAAATDQAWHPGPTPEVCDLKDLSRHRQSGCPASPCSWSVQPNQLRSVQANSTRSD